MNSGIARTPAERAAFAALNAHRLEDAQTRFTELLEKDPTNGRAAAGMGFLRMQQNNFAGAISYFTQAEQNGYKDRTVENALADLAFLVHHGRSDAGLQRERAGDRGGQIQGSAGHASAQPRGSYRAWPGST